MLCYTYEGGPKKTGFSLKKKIYLYFEQKTLNPLQNTLHWRQYTCPIFFPTVWSISGTAEAWCCWAPPAKLFSPPPRWQSSFLSMFFPLSGIKRNHRGLGPVNRVGGERQSIPERPNTGSQTKLCELELDNTWENWQHKPVQPSTATSARLLTREGCNYTHLAGEHSTTIRKSSLKPVRFFLGPPSYTAYPILFQRKRVKKKSVFWWTNKKMFFYEMPVTV